MISDIFIFSYLLDNVSAKNYIDEEFRRIDIKGRVSYDFYATRMDIYFQNMSDSDRYICIVINA